MISHSYNAIALACVQKSSDGSNHMMEKVAALCTQGMDTGCKRMKSYPQLLLFCFYSTCFYSIKKQKVVPFLSSVDKYIKLYFLSV